MRRARMHARMNIRTLDVSWQANLVVAVEEERVTKAHELCRQSEQFLRSLLRPE